MSTPKNATELYGMPIGIDTEWEAVIGLEVHIQLATESKIFSTARARLEEGKSVADEGVNINTTPVCAGHPGTLPVLNKKAVRYAVMAGLATNCKINLKSQFARKHYFYPDSPKGYQISQYDLPTCEKGFLDIELGETGEVTKRIGITRIHMEEDAGKSVHMAGFSLVNLNRAGVPLVECVSEPDMRTPEEAGAYLRKLYSIVTYLGVCDGNLQEGNFRCDANVSVRPKGCTRFGTRTETKNVNSFRFVEKAIEYEIERQQQVLLSGGMVTQETRLYDSQKNQTFLMRTKEEAEDYRYFPDPDLPPLLLEATDVEELRTELPELPDQKKTRYIKDFGMSRADAIAITAQKNMAQFFEKVVELLPSRGVTATQVARSVANLLTGEATRLLNEANQDILVSKFYPEHFADLAKMVQEKTISITAAKQIVGMLFAATKPANVEQLVEQAGLKQVSDLSALEPVIEQIIAANPKQAEEFRAGKEKILGFFVGQAMKATGGKANPGMLQDLVIKKLKGN